MLIGLKGSGIQEHLELRMLLMTSSGTSRYGFEIFSFLTLTSFVMWHAIHLVQLSHPFQSIAESTHITSEDKVQITLLELDQTSWLACGKSNE